MVTYTLTLTDAQAAALTYQNNGAYPTDEAFLNAYFAPVCDQWVSAQTAFNDTQVLAAFKAAKDTATKTDIVATATTISATPILAMPPVIG